ncbi:hypothetical protein BJF81_10845 [Ornithinimicrobium sp. CNJ-824]|nr:hypothetical protein BJF81_10845 [Ornithinimicrobium sp. CNJ-824]
MAPGDQTVDDPAGRGRGDAQALGELGGAGRSSMMCSRTAASVCDRSARRASAGVARRLVSSRLRRASRVSLRSQDPTHRLCARPSPVDV